MAKPNKPQAKWNQKTKCEYSGCGVTFSRISDRRRHVREKHGPLLYCRIPGCEWSTRRIGRLRTHLDNVHHSGVSTNFFLPSDFRTATAQSLASSDHFCTPDVNSNYNFVPTTPQIPIYYAFTPQDAPQFPPEAPEAYPALNSNEAPPSPGEHNPTPASSTTGLRARVRAPNPQRIFRLCRVRRRKARSTAQGTSSTDTDPPLSRRISAMDGDTTFGFYPTVEVEGQDNGHGCPTTFTQGGGMSCAFSVEPIASFLGGLSLACSIE